MSTGHRIHRTNRSCKGSAGSGVVRSKRSLSHVENPAARNAIPESNRVHFNYTRMASTSSGTARRTRVADPIMVTAFATGDPGTTREEACTEIRFPDRRGEWKKTIIPASMLTAQANEFIKLLSRLGYKWPKDKKLWAQTISELSVVTPRRNIRVTSVPGWHGKFFVLPGESYGAKGSIRKRLRNYI